MFSRVIFSLIALVTSIHCFSNPTQEQLNSFFEAMVQQARDTLPGLSPLPPTPAPSPTPLERFTNQNFLLWDYLEDVSDNNDCLQHFTNLIAFCKRRKISRVILFIKNPDSFEFFQSNNTDTNSFIYQANLLYSTMRNQAGVSNFDIAVFFDNNTFDSNAPAGTTPTVNPEPSSELAGYFVDIDNMLDWAKAVIPQVTGITEITFDPEFSGANKNIQQLVYNYSDEYKYLNSLDSIRLGTTIGVDESKVTYANLSSFPVNDTYKASITTFPASSPPSWRSSNSSSLLQSVYVQVYQSSIPAIFAAGYDQPSGIHNGATAATYFNKLLRDLPYVTGSGTITFSQGDSAVTGTSTTFSNFADPILFANDTVNNRKDRKIGVVSSVTNNNLLSLEFPYATFTETNSPFKRTEIATAWNTQPVLTQQMFDNIYWMLSLEYSSPLLLFFGNWQLGDFMDFISNSITTNSTPSIAPFTNSTTSTALSFPGGNNKNFVIYDYYQATTTVNTTPRSNGQVAPWNL